VTDLKELVDRHLAVWNEPDSDRRREAVRELPSGRRRQAQLGVVRTSDGEVAAVGLEVLVLDDDGRIRTDHQFIEA
jgi:hypothetical protein